MTLRVDHSMNEQLAWAQWWAFPWKYAHEDWRSGPHTAIDELCQGRLMMPGDFLGVAACLPPPPHSTALRLALASNEELNLALTLVHDTFNPETMSALSDSHHLWCVRLSKALPPAMLAPDADPLHLLHSWLAPPIWQRLRLRFSRERTHGIEKRHLRLENANNRLDTLWQAVVWRATSLSGEPIRPTQTDQEISNVMPTHH